MSYQQALQDIKLGYFEAAIAKLDPLLHKDPSQAKLWYAKALVPLRGSHSCKRQKAKGWISKDFKIL